MKFLRSIDPVARQAYYTLAIVFGVLLGALLLATGVLDVAFLERYVRAIEVVLAFGLTVVGLLARANIYPRRT